MTAICPKAVGFLILKSTTLEEKQAETEGLEAAELHHIFHRMLERLSMDK